ncbi:putative secreted protein (Por secretion system target) [Chryseobacterium sp. 52]|uniref:T9SS type A sorting domain-containing protein n=1 Tax=Chryseobacterium sp. 52 TaxID=2035213 RepID=UPI000C18B902|nr:T9SS type A sorting domain-containing protein [Chryseobacterium sp. 52]PIF45464.1 putative secreted protein (Por secretion system target) [Chryseobacterium sp. 52]
MKKIILSIALIATNYAFSQISLEHSFTDNEDVFVYNKDNSTQYVSMTSDNKIKIYNSSYILQKTVNVPMPSNHGMFYSGHFGENSFFMSKHVFNNDDKYEFMVETYFQDTVAGTITYKLLLINEDGNLIKDFHPNPLIKQSSENFEVYHDNVNNTNKLIVHNWVNGSSNQYDVYSLPTTTLTTKAIQLQNKLSAFPIPTNKILNIINPDNGANKVQIYDTSGKLIINKSFSSNDDKISIDVENLTKGIYIYKIGELSSKFIKN